MQPLTITHPFLINEQWDYDKNITLPESLSKGSHQKAYWICQHGHSKYLSVKYKVKHPECSTCSRETSKVSRPVSLYAPKEVIREWDHEKNTKEPHEVSIGSTEYIWFQCLERKHSYRYRIDNKVRGSQCPLCIKTEKVLQKHGSKVLPHGDVPDFMKKLFLKRSDELDIVVPLKTRDIMCQWKCDKGHIWESSPQKVLSNNGKCPECNLKNSSNLSFSYPDIAAEWDHEKNSVPLETVSYGSNISAHWKCLQGHTWITEVHNRTRRDKPTGCPYCARKFSKSEKEILEFITDNLSGSIIKTNDRSIINPYEIDIYIPQKKIAIEYNGLYWHSEAQKDDKWVHHRKYELCRNKGIQLITIWEDDWKHKQDIVKNMILHKLGVSTKKKLPARKTEVTHLESNDARIFLEKHHIQGFHAGTAYIGLKDHEGNIVAVSVWTIQGEKIYLDRFATSIIVQGGFSKLLKQGIEFARFHKSHSIITFAAHDVSDGKLYENNNFILEEEQPPQYYYLYQGKRHHRFNFRIDRFIKDKNLIYEENRSEKELAADNNLLRIWDCGKSKYILKL